MADRPPWLWRRLTAMAGAGGFHQVRAKDIMTERVVCVGVREIMLGPVKLVLSVGVSAVRQSARGD